MGKQDSLATISQEPTSEQLASSDVIRQFLVKFGELYGKLITSALVLIWVDELREIPAEQLTGMFRRVIRTFKADYGRTFPTPADVLQPLENSPAPRAEADLKWNDVLDFVRRHYSADLPGCLSRGAPRISERTMTAIRAAGGIAWIADCGGEALVWCKKSFIESYVAWETLDRDQYLLPEDSPVRDLLFRAALQMSPDQTEGLLDDRMGKALLPPADLNTARIAELEQRVSVADRLAVAARAVIDLGKTEPPPVSDARLTAMNAQAETIATQAEMVKQRFPMTIPDSLPPDARRYIR
jgi:hypothetical protein